MMETDRQSDILNQDVQIFGYVRVSSLEQCEDRQLIALADRQVLSENIYVDKQSGKDFERPQYQLMV